uniref:Uncharacterized protein n=1 Tax=virus sp. ctBM815 TaxID=2825806 RepID=A0A8S5RKR8_9VIRU|nr:MAG TPA: hypothetical protein [virus sp. ctBM815]DAV23984.1 MAG TPA: hypothetical protein [Bacteriophage sp.]
MTSLHSNPRMTVTKKEYLYHMIHLHHLRL